MIFYLGILHSIIGEESVHGLPPDLLALLPGQRKEEGQGKG